MYKFGRVVYDDKSDSIESGGLNMNKGEESKIIYLVYGDISRTIFESQVLVHSELMHSNGINIEIMVFSQPNTFSESKKNMGELSMKYNIPISLFRGIRPAIPFSEVLNSIFLYKKLFKKGNRQNYIIRCRTEYAAAVCAFLKPFAKFTLIWDARGDTESEFILKRKSWKGIKRVFSFWKLLSIKIRLYLSSKYADKAIFVSNALRDLYVKKSSKYKFSVLPCVADTGYFYFDSTLRQSFRKDLKIREDELVFIYSGSLAPWQCWDETITLFKSFLNTNSKSKLIVLTPDVVGAKEYLHGITNERLIIRSVTMQDVNKYLNAADIAFFLRHTGPVNYVASPVKFAEYCLSGLPIIMTSAVEQSYHIANQLGNAITYDFGHELISPISFTDGQRLYVAEQAKKYLSHDAVLKQYVELYLKDNIFYD